MSDLLLVPLVVALVIASVVLLSFALRPIMPPSRPPLSDAELDEQTLRNLGLTGDIEPAPPTTPHRPAAVIAFPRRPLGPRDPILDENERLYRDPIVAARLRAVLEPNRRRLRRITPSSSDRPGGELRAWPSASPPPGSGRVGKHDRRRVRHTDREQSQAGARDGADRDQEPTQMSTSDPEPMHGDLSFFATGADEPTREGQAGASAPTRTPEDSPPSSADVELPPGGPRPRSKVLPFVPRQAPDDRASEEMVVDPTVVAAITATVRELLFCANVGEYLHGFALYSDRYLFRFMDETGLTVDEFRAAFENGSAKEADEWTRLAHLGDVRRLDDGRVAAVVSYLDGNRPGGSERYTFEFSAARGLWLIDDIEQI